jgi:hypothetical protein
MGNLSFIVPTKKLEDFNIDKVYDLLVTNFSDLTIDLDKNFNQIQVFKNGNLVTDLYFNQDIYILDIKRDIDELLKLREVELAEWLIVLQKLNPDLDNVIQTTYGSGRFTDIKQDIDFLIKDYFTSYLFDEGIHPEFMPPDYKRKKKKKFF